MKNRQKKMLFKKEIYITDAYVTHMSYAFVSFLGKEFNMQDQFLPFSILFTIQQRSLSFNTTKLLRAHSNFAQESYTPMDYFNHSVKVETHNISYDKSGGRERAKKNNISSSM
jgi:hypothetical protein